MTLRMTSVVAAAAAAIVTVSAQQAGPAIRQIPAGGAPPPGASGVPTGPGAAQSQTPQAPPTGLILGRTVDATTERPLAGVTVYVRGGAPGGPVTFGSSGVARVLTDAEGRFVLRDLPSGSFTITATKPGYVPGAYGKRSVSSAGQAIELTDAARVGNVTIPLWKYGVIGGRVVDEAGEPMSGVPIRVLRRAVVAGQWQLSPAGEYLTDDRGIYRTESLVPGQYIVGFVSAIAAAPIELYENYMRAIAAGTSQEFNRSIDPAGSVPGGAGVRMGDQVYAPGGGTTQPRVESANNEGLVVYPTVFYPSAPTVTQADILTIAPGAERSNVDFHLQPSPSVSVAGTVVGPDGPSSSTSLQLLPVGADRVQRETGFEAATAISDRRGAFKFIGVVPGQYTIRVLRTPPRSQVTSSGVTSVVQLGGTTITSFSSVGTAPPPIPDDPTLSGVLSVSVGQADVSGLSVVLSRGARIAGRVEFTGNTQKPAPAAMTQLNLVVDSSDGRSAGALSTNSINRLQVDAQGAVRSYQFPSGRYLIRGAGAPAGWTFAGAFLDGKDVSVTPFELGVSDVEGLVVKYTDRAAELSGTVRDDNRAVDRNVDVLIFPADSRAWTDYGPAPRRFRNVVTSTSGTYRIMGVADGDNFVVAVGEGLPNDWQDVDVLKRLASFATRVTISEGDKKVQDLKVGVLR